MGVNHTTLSLKLERRKQWWQASIVGSEGNAAIDRTLLQGSAYKDDKNLQARQSIWEFATTELDLWWRVADVPWSGQELVLDIGCGNGLDTGQLAARAACGGIVAADLSLGMLHSVQPWSSSAAVPIHLVQADIAALPYQDTCADVVLGMHMLYHVPDIAAALGEVRRVLRSGGVFLASTNSRGSMAQMTELLDEAVSTVLGRRVIALPELGFTLENGAGQLDPFFASVELRRYRSSFAVPSAAPVVAAGATSVRDPVIATVGPLPWDAVETEYRMRVEKVISRDGVFRVDAEAGVFVCHV